ncbi:MAG: hypothetical protein H6589_06875 [Flavobacteriales bacterium]|nr:hypothetical protein [Flavobacteriales bacterium]
MKNIIKGIISLTIISLFLFTKWWYVLPDDAPDIILWGFPFPYAGDGFHTSMSVQIFTLELILDVIIHLLIWSTLILSIHRFFWKIKIKKSLTILLITASSILLIIPIFIAFLPDTVFNLRKDWDMEIRETGCKFIWENQPRIRR